MSLLRTKGKMKIEGNSGLWTADSEERSFERSPSFVPNWDCFGSWNWRGHKSDLVVEASLLVNRTTGMVDHFECKVRIPHQCNV